MGSRHIERGLLKNRFLCLCEVGEERVGLLKRAILDGLGGVRLQLGDAGIVTGHRSHLLSEHFVVLRDFDKPFANVLGWHLGLAGRIEGSKDLPLVELKFVLKQDKRGLLRSAKSCSNCVRSRTSDSSTSGGTPTIASRPAAMLPWSAEIAVRCHIGKRLTWDDLLS